MMEKQKEQWQCESGMQEQLCEVTSLHSMQVRKQVTQVHGAGVQV